VASVNDNDHSGCPSTYKTDENVTGIKDHVHENRCITIYNLANEMGISSGSWQKSKCVIN
jgi:hypothetical protein